MITFTTNCVKQKKEKLGGVIPKEQLKQSAIQSQNEFMLAMQEQSSKFELLKKERGSEDAIDLFKRDMDLDAEVEEEDDGWA
mmetsp:Transcript_19781/g.29025  ORF Transcript_19781/g.29025 Transcript_19781/m.29025 type:complete len:82 (-) Transcript_19781:426-671(-)